MRRVINFGAGPAKISDEVLKRVQEEFIVLDGTGTSIVVLFCCFMRVHIENLLQSFKGYVIYILELGHRTSDFKNMLNETVKLLRDEMSIPNEYTVLFMHGGATAQFAAIPVNLRDEHDSADYAITGRWSQAAAKEGSKYIDVRKVFKPLERFDTVPDFSTWDRNPNAAYLYYCSNETVDGVEFKDVPETTPAVPLIADVSSNILSRPFSFINHGLVFASTQKNLGAAGLAIAIVRKDLIKPTSGVPSILSYYEMERTLSNYNTPNVFGIYVTKLVLEWIRDQGGVEEMAKRNEKKAKLIYDVIDSSSGFYYSFVEPKYRSSMNIPFRITNEYGNAEELEAKFLAGAVRKGMIGLKGHRSVGGIRASLYNAMTVEETDILREYMEEFQKTQSIE
ncbi:unnamed protein product [Enterobius vermicularis]|uniref:phosphoserine transaminase n=1 Tax=Enterobius vermicularis TaxID=51028 RepID=A0A0N4VCH6_ENTVE|nr:unnamed protein product [Enterobius vermicularis]